MATTNDRLSHPRGVLNFFRTRFIRPPSIQNNVIMGGAKYIFIHIPASRCDRNIILMSKHTFLRSTNTIDTFSNLYLWPPSWNQDGRHITFVLNYIGCKVTPKSFCCAMESDVITPKLLENVEQSILWMNNNMWCREVTAAWHEGSSSARGDFGFGQI